MIWKYLSTFSAILLLETAEQTWRDNGRVSHPSPLLFLEAQEEKWSSRRTWQPRLLLRMICLVPKSGEASTKLAHFSKCVQKGGKHGRNRHAASDKPELPLTLQIVQRTVKSLSGGAPHCQMAKVRPQGGITKEVAGAPSAVAKGHATILQQLTELNPWKLKCLSFVLPYPTPLFRQRSCLVTVSMSIK